MELVPVADPPCHYEEFEDKQFQYRCRQFYCGMLPDEVPQNIMQQVLPKMAPKMMDGNIFKAEKIAPYLVAKGMISYDEFYEITNKCINPSDRAQKVYAMLPSKGNGALTLVRFYHCLIESAQKDRLESHYTIACELRLLALMFSGLKRPILAEGVSRLQVANGMVEKLQGIIVKECDTQNLCQLMNLPDNAIPSGDTDLVGLCQHWKEAAKSSYSPVSLVEVLMPIRGMGKCLSGLFCPCNPPIVDQFLIELKESWICFAKFIGFRQNELEKVQGESVEQCIQSFLQVWEMPDCGYTKTLRILERVASLADIQPTRYPLPLSGGTDIMTLMPFGIKAGQEPLSVKAHIPNDTKMSGIPQMELKLSVEFYPNLSTGLHHPWAMVRAFDEKSKLPEEDHCWEGHSVEKSKAVQPHLSPVPCPAKGEESPVQYLMEKLDEPSDTKCDTDRQFTTECEVIRDDNHPLIQCCKRQGKLDQLKALMQEYGHLNVQQSSNGAHPLHLAVMCESLEMVQILVEGGCNIDAVMDNHSTPLMIACKKSKLDIVKYLVRHGATISEKNCDGYCCLHFKETLENMEILTSILGEREGPLQCDIPSDGGRLTPLTKACLMGAQAYQVVQYLLSCNADPNGVDEAEINPLTAAVTCGCEDLVILLLDNDAKIDLQDREGRTAILKACQYKHRRIMQKLIDAGASLNIPDATGTTTVSLAVESGSNDFLTFILQYNPDVNHPMGIGTDRNANPMVAQLREVTPIGLACGKGRLDMVELLLDKGANIFFGNERTLTALSFAILGGHTQVVEFLLKQNQLRKGVDELREPFVIAVRFGNVNLANMVLNHMGNSEKVLNIASATGDTELTHYVHHLHEMTKGVLEETNTGSTNGQFLTETRQQVTRENEERMISATLREFMNISIDFIVEMAEQSYVITEAQKLNCDHLVIFFEQYFSCSSIGGLLKEFLQSEAQPTPAKFLFGLPKFDMGEFARALLDKGKQGIMEQIQVTLLALLRTEQSHMEGRELLYETFGTNFNEVFTRLHSLTRTCNETQPSPLELPEGAGVNSIQMEATVSPPSHTPLQGVQRLPQDTETLATHVKGTAENVLTQHTQDGTPSVEAQTTIKERYEPEPGTTPYINGMRMGRNPEEVQTSPRELTAAPKPTQPGKQLRTTPQKSIPQSSSPSLSPRLCRQRTGLNKEGNVELHTLATVTATAAASPDNNLSRSDLSQRRLAYYERNEPPHCDNLQLSQRCDKDHISLQTVSTPSVESQSKHHVSFQSQSPQKHNSPQTKRRSHGVAPFSSDTSTQNTESDSKHLYKRADSAYYSLEDEQPPVHDEPLDNKVIAYDTDLPSDLHMERMLCNGAIHKGYTKVQLQFGSPGSGLLEFDLIQSKDSFFNALDLFYSHFMSQEERRVSVTLVFTT